jgi:hypothetical protein
VIPRQSRLPSAPILAGTGLLLLAVAVIILSVVSRLPGYAVQPLTIAIPSAAVGLLVVRSQARNLIGWLLLGIAAALLVSTAAGAWSVLIFRQGRDLPLGQVALIGYQLWSPALALFLLVILLFPDGRLPSPRWRWPAWAYVALCAGYLSLLAGVAADAIAGHEIRVDRAYGGLTVIDYPAGLFALAQDAIVALIVVMGAAFACRQLLAWHRASGPRRDQLKWLIFGTAICLACAALSIPGENERSGTWALLNNMLAVGFVALPAGIGVGILRYRLYDIDRVISRTVAYVIVTGALVGAYAVLVTLAHGLVPYRSPLAVALATLVAVAVFEPLRRRVQRVVDRRFNRARYDAEATIAAFAARMQDAGDLDQVRGDLAAVVQQIMQPEQAVVWLTEQELIDSEPPGGP